MTTPYSAMMKSARTPAEQRRLREYDRTKYAVDVVVKSVVHELGMAIAQDDDGDLELHLQDSTPGVHLGDLRAGQKLQVCVQGVLAPKVLSATWVA